jgi:hypothetical protein
VQVSNEKERYLRKTKRSKLTGSAEVVLREVIGGLEGEVIHQPAVTEGTVRYVRDAEFFGCVDEIVRLVQGLEGGVFGLDGVDFRDCEGVRGGLRAGEKRTHLNSLSAMFSPSIRIGRCISSSRLCGLSRGLGLILRGGYLVGCYQHGNHLGECLVPLTGINSMQIIQIRRKSKSFDRPLDVFLDVGGGIGDLAVAAVHAVEAAF